LGSKFSSEASGWATSGGGGEFFFIISSADSKVDLELLFLDAPSEEKASCLTNAGVFCFSSADAGLSRPVRRLSDPSRLTRRCPVKGLSTNSFEAPKPALSPEAAEIPCLETWTLLTLLATAFASFSRRFQSGLCWEIRPILLFRPTKLASTEGGDDGKNTMSLMDEELRDRRELSPAVVGLLMVEKDVVQQLLVLPPRCRWTGDSSIDTSTPVLTEDEAIEALEAAALTDEVAFKPKGSSSSSFFFEERIEEILDETCWLVRRVKLVEVELADVC